MTGQVFYIDAIGSFDVPGRLDSYSALGSVTVTAGDIERTVALPEGIFRADQVAAAVAAGLEGTPLAPALASVTTVALDETGALVPDAGDIGDAVRLGFDAALAIDSVEVGLRETFLPSPGEPEPYVVAGPDEATRAAQDIALLYEAALDRNGAIDPPGLTFWVGRLEDGATPEQISAAFLASDEFATVFGDPDGQSDAELVARFYEVILGREADAGGLEFWTDRLADPGFDRADLLLAFARSPENVTGSPYVDTVRADGEGGWELAETPPALDLFIGDIELRDPLLSRNELFDLTLFYGNAGTDPAAADIDVFLFDNDESDPPEGSGTLIFTIEDADLRANESVTLDTGAMPIDGFGNTDSTSGSFLLGARILPADELLEDAEPGNDATALVPVTFSQGSGVAPDGDLDDGDLFG